ncbi:MAG TPA: hypothetical protein ENH01_03615 [Nitrospirae bacterium]|nr:hypothetical protein [Nitrospirota bacterium]
MHRAGFICPYEHCCKQFEFPVDFSLCSILFSNALKVMLNIGMIPAGRNYAVTFNNLSLLSSKLSALAATTTYTYDSLNRITKEDYMYDAATGYQTVFI